MFLSGGVTKVFVRFILQSWKIQESRSYFVTNITHNIHCWDLRVFAGIAWAVMYYERPVENVTSSIY